MNTETLAAIGLEFLVLSLRAMERGEREVPPEEIEEARLRGKHSHRSLHDAIEEYEERAGYENDGGEE